MGTVYAYTCPDYRYEDVKNSLLSMLSDSGFLDSLEAGKVLLLKPNLLMGKSPEAAVTTHPIVVRALVEIFTGIGLKVIVGDSPGGPLTMGLLKQTYAQTGMTEAVDGTSGELNYNLNSREIESEAAYTLKRYPVLEVVLDCDYLVSVAKLKTHGMMTFTGAVKNLYGVIPGLVKASHHFKLKSREQFASHILDLCEFIDPDFSIIDGISGMEGNGPSGGEVVNTGILIGGLSPYEVDHYAASAVGIHESKVPIIYLARARKLFADYEVSGDVDTNKLKKYKLPDSSDVTFLPKRMPRFLRNWILKRSRYTPVFVHRDCVKCGKCINICPAKIISFNTDGYPVFNEDNCISCFCCHEVCPYRAIEIKKPLLARVFRR